MFEPDRWLLPEGIDEALPAEAERLEAYRRRLIDLYHAWGYELVMPPFIDYLDSLLTGTGHDLDLKTFKLTDQLSGRLLGLRADMTPQVARIDAHRMRPEGANRLCYLGTVLHTRPDGFASTRAPLQVGAELYGHAGPDSDLEIIRLTLETLRVCGIESVYMDLGHVGIYRALIDQAGLTADQQGELFDMLQRKALPEIEAHVGSLGLGADLESMLLALSELNGGDEVLESARRVLEPAGEPVRLALDYLADLADRVRLYYPQVSLHFDLAELRGYHYHTGLLFAAYVPGEGQEIARGGRYDEIGAVFGRARPATGFSTDLKTLVRLSAEPWEAASRAIWAPAEADAGLEAEIARLRAAGERVIQALAGEQLDPRGQGCDRRLVRRGEGWQIEGVD
ncbi:MAG: ATP phosphoribosyltransferase regulatory subunit [Chromatiales bacterium]|jgi:ATP phosphoribosyltransferase regulatory subunit